MLKRLIDLITRLVFKAQPSPNLINALPRKSNQQALLILDVLKEREALQKGLLRNANLSGLQGYNIRLATAILEHVNFQDADLREGYFGKAQLTGANFRQADLTQANFRDAILKQTDFTHAKASNAYFAGAKLNGAQFDGADLRGANFWGAEIEGASFVDVLTDDETIMPQ
jgi:uncharacterized protein YjbI with pentapeptide repeats